MIYFPCKNAKEKLPFVPPLSALYPPRRGVTKSIGTLLAIRPQFTEEGVSLGLPHSFSLSQESIEKEVSTLLATGEIDQMISHLMELIWQGILGWSSPLDDLMEGLRRRWGVNLKIINFLWRRRTHSETTNIIRPPTLSYHHPLTDGFVVIAGAVCFPVSIWVAWGEGGKG